MKRKFLALVLAATMVFSMAACGKKADTNTSTDNTKTEDVKTDDTKTDDTKTPSTDNAAPVEITWWAFPNIAQEEGVPAGTYEQQIIDAFTAKNPNIKVKLEMLDFTAGPEKITAAIEGGTMADVLFDAPGRIITYGKAGVLVPLNDMFTDELIKDVNNDVIINACKGGDNFYMYPLGTGPFMMGFDKKKLEAAGTLDLVNLEGDRTWTTDKFQELITKMKEAGYKGGTVYCSGQGGDQGIRAFVTNLFDSSVTNSEITGYTINDEGGVKALEFIKKAVDDGTMLNGSAYNGGEDLELFSTGQTYFTTLWSSDLQGKQAENLSNSGVEPILIPFPSADGVPTLEYLVNGFCIFNNKDDAKVEASKKFIEFICNDTEMGPKNVKATKTFPVRQSFGNIYEGDETMTYLSGMVKYYSPYYNTIDGFAEMRTKWFPMLQAVVNGDVTPKEAAEQFVKDANASIANAQ